MLKVGLIGTGFIGSAHATNIARHPATTLAAVHDVVLDRAKSVAGKTGARPVKDVQELFDDRGIDAIFITSTTHTHVDYLTRCAKAGKAVYCEKPIALDYAEAPTAVEILENSGIPAMIGFNRRFDPNHAELQAEVSAGAVGKIEIIQMTSRGPKPPPLEYIAISGGQMRDHAIHFFDLLRWVSGDEVAEVHAYGAALVDPNIGEAGDVDTSVVSLRMKSGAFCQLDCSRRTGYGYDERIEVFGSEGLIESRRQRARGVSRYTGDKVIEDGLHPGWFERVEQSYYEALNAFVESITKGRPVPSPMDGIKAQLIADKATESLRNGRSVRVE